MIRFSYTARVLVVGICLGGAGVPARAAEVDKLLPNDTEFVVQIDVRQILDSALFKKYALESLKAALKGNDEAQKVVQALGLDPFKDVNRIVNASAGSGKTSKGLTIVYGRFDATKLPAGAAELAKQFGVEMKVHTQESVRLYEYPLPEGAGTTDKGFAALLDDKTLVAGDKESVLDALAKHTGKKQTTIKKELQALIEKVDDKHGIWFAGTAIRLGGVNIDGIDDKTKEKIQKVLDTFDTVAGGLHITDDVKFEMNVTAKNAKAVDEVRDTLSEGLGALKAGVLLLTTAQPKLQPLGDALATFKVRSKDASVTLSGQIAGDVIEKTRKAVEELIEELMNQ